MSRFGSRLVITCAVLVMAITLPLLLTLSSTTAMAKPKTDPYRSHAHRLAQYQLV